MQRGAVLLDQHRPEWATYIGEGFDLSDPDRCILGSAFRDYTQGLHEVAPASLYNDDGEGDDYEFAVQHGFDGGFDGDGPSWALLEGEWLYQVGLRT